MAEKGEYRRAYLLSDAEHALVLAGLSEITACDAVGQKVLDDLIVDLIQQFTNGGAMLTRIEPEDSGK